MSACFEFSPDQSERERVVAFFQSILVEYDAKILIEPQEVNIKKRNSTLYIIYSDRVGFYGNNIEIYYTQKDDNLVSEITGFLSENFPTYSDCDPYPTASMDHFDFPDTE